MSDTESEETPHDWAPSTDEPNAAYEEYERAQAFALAEAEQEQRIHRLLFRWTAGVLAVLGFLGICSAAGYSVGPGGGQQTICEAAGGRMIDRVVAHRCAP